jgi:hypothetical protein
MTSGNRQTKGMRASNDEDCCGSNQGVFLVARKPPIGESNRTRGDRDVKKDRGRTVGKCLRARAGRLRGGDEPHDSGKSGLVPDCRNTDAKASAADNGSRNDFGAATFGSGWTRR